MILRNPQPNPEFKHQFNNVETAKEIPAMPKESSLHPSWHDVSKQPTAMYPSWHDELPKPRYQQNMPVFREPLDPEKLAARATWIMMGIFALVVMGICMIKVVLMVLALK